MYHPRVSFPPERITRGENAGEEGKKRQRIATRETTAMTTASLLPPPVKRNYGGGGNVGGYLHRARIQSDTMDHFDPNVSLFCSRGRRNEKHHLAILTGWRASPER